MIGSQFRVDPLVGLAELERVIAAVVLGELLFDYVGLNGDAEVVSLSRQIGGAVIVDFPGLERSVSQVAPQDGEHPKLVCARKRFGDLLELSLRFLGPEIDRRPYPGAALLVRLIDRPEDYLIVGVWVREKLIVIELENEWDLVCVLARDRPEHAEGRSNGVAPSFDRESHDVLRIEVLRVGCERSAGRVLDALIDRQDGQVARTREPPVVKHSSEVAQYLRPAISRHHDTVYEVGPWQMQHLFGNGSALIGQQRFGFVAEDLLDVFDHIASGCRATRGNVARSE